MLFLKLFQPVAANFGDKQKEQETFKGNGDERSRTEHRTNQRYHACAWEYRGQRSPKNSVCGMATSRGRIIRGC